MPFELSLMRKQHALFSKSWPKGVEYTMSDFEYFNRKLGSVKGYNWLLLPSVTSQGEPQYIGSLPGELTMKFTLGLPFTSTTIVSTTLRIRVMVETSDHFYQVYMDENANLFMNNTTDECVGKVNMIYSMWDGTVALDTNKSKKLYPTDELL